MNECSALFLITEYEELLELIKDKKDRFVVIEIKGADTFLKICRGNEFVLLLGK
jgi:hypothetical protein